MFGLFITIILMIFLMREMLLHDSFIELVCPRQILYDCGVRVTPDTLAMARSLLGLKGPDDTCTLETFEKW